MTLITPTFFNFPRSKIPSGPSTSRTYISYNMRVQRYDLRFRDPNGTSITSAPVSAKLSIRRDSGVSTTSRAHSTASLEVEFVRTYAPLPPPDGVDAETMMQALYVRLRHLSKSGDYLQAREYINACEELVAHTIYEGISERIHMDFLFRRTIDSSTHALKRHVFAESLRVHLREWTFKRRAEVRYASRVHGEKGVNTSSVPQDESQDCYGSVFYVTTDDEEEDDEPEGDDALTSSKPRVIVYGRTREEEEKLMYEAIDEAWYACQESYIAGMTLEMRTSGWARLTNVGRVGFYDAKILEEEWLGVSVVEEAEGADDAEGLQEYNYPDEDAHYGDDFVVGEAVAQEARRFDVPEAQWIGAANLGRNGSVEDIKQEVDAAIRDWEPEDMGELDLLGQCGHVQF